MTFERYTERARQAVVLAQAEARNTNCSFISVDHLILGLMAEEEGLAAQVLAKVGVKAEDVRTHVPVAHTASLNADPIPFTRPAKRAQELALREALALGHNYIGTEHLLLGICQVKKSNGELIGSFDPDQVRNQVLTGLGAFRKATEEYLAEVDETKHDDRFTAETSWLEVANVLYEELHGIRQALESK